MAGIEVSKDTIKTSLKVLKFDENKLQQLMMIDELSKDDHQHLIQVRLAVKELEALI